MSEVKEKKQAAEGAPEAGAKKKKGAKLPIIVALALTLGTGGFFAMKMRGGKPAEAKVELGEMVEMEEFLTNLVDKNSYVRTKIALHMAKGFKPETMAKSLPAVQDAIVTELSRRSLNEVASLEGKAKLKHAIATSVNKVLAVNDTTEKHEGEEPGAGSEGEPKPEVPEGWDSAKGPVLKVYFVSFATQ